MPAAGWRIAAAAVALVGLAYRLQDFGRYAFWTDEAWVALTTRVAGWEQWWLGLSVTPIGWAALLQPLAMLGGTPEVTLRLLPLAASLVTLALAYRVGTRVAGHPAGGLAATALIATDPLSIEYAKMLKQYGTEACMALLALERALRIEATGRGLGGLAAVLVIGSLVANTQGFVAPAVLLAVAASCWQRGNTRLAGATVATGAGVGIWSAAVYALVLRPHQTPALATYYETSFLPVGDLGTTAYGIAVWLQSLVTLVLGPIGAAAALAALAWRRWRGADGGIVLVVALATLLGELLVLSAMRLVPLTEGRVLLFCTTMLGVAGAASLAACATAAGRGERVVATLLLVLAAGGLVAERDWGTIGASSHVEDLGPLVQRVERERTPADRVLVYGAGSYIYAYYQRETPVLLPSATTTVGYTPRLPGGVVGVGAQDVGEVMRAALAAGGRVWLVASRVKATDAPAIERAVRQGRVEEHVQRHNAQLVIVGPPA